MEKYNTLKNKKDFNLFMNNLSDYNLRIKNILKKDELTYEEDEVKLISKYFLELNENRDFDNESKKAFIAYLGEAFMKIFGGEWDFTGLKSDSFAINEPVITKYKNEGIRMSPSETIYKIFEEKNENYFNWSIKYMEDFQNKTDDIFAELFPKKKKK